MPTYLVHERYFIESFNMVYPVTMMVKSDPAYRAYRTMMSARRFPVAVALIAITSGPFPIDVSCFISLFGNFLCRRSDSHNPSVSRKCPQVDEAKRNGEKENIQCDCIGNWN